MRCAQMILLAILSICGCGPSGKPVHTGPAPADAGPQVRVEPTSQIFFDCQPVEAQVNVDGKDHGTVARIGEKGLTLPLGHHRIEITMPGHRPFRFELILDRKPERIKVELQPLRKQK